MYQKCIKRGLDSLFTITPYPATPPPSGNHPEDALSIQGPTPPPLPPATLIAKRTTMFHTHCFLDEPIT